MYFVDLVADKSNYSFSYQDKLDKQVEKKTKHSLY